jgi:hypothetical protein
MSMIIEWQGGVVMEIVAAPAKKVRSPEIEAAIRRRAQELYELRGRTPGHEVEDWLQAEAEVMRPAAPKAAYVVVRLDGVTYAGEYDPELCDGYTPGEFRTGAPLEVRFEGDKMFVKRPNGRELEARLVRKMTD